MVKEPQEVQLGPWVKGVNTVAPVTSLANDALREAINVDLFKDGRVRRRDGFTSVLSLPGAHSLFAAAGVVLVADATTLYSADPVTWELTGVRDDLSGQPVSYAQIADTIYFSDGAITGRYYPRTGGARRGFGVANPNSAPVATTVGYGGFPAGVYQIGVTHFDDTGNESGCVALSSVELVDGQGIRLDHIPVSEYSTRVYVSAPNGSAGELYSHGSFPPGTSVAELPFATVGRRLSTMFYEPMPAGTIVRHYNGRLFVATDSVLWYSAALRYGQHEPDFSFLQFPAEITVVEPGSDGLFVVADQTYFLQGVDPAQFKLLTVYQYGGIPRTGTQIPASILELELGGSVPYWYADTGAVVGLPGGRVLSLMEGKVALPAYESGATLLREYDGLRQLITSLAQPGEVSSFGATDYASAEIRRNGIVL